MDTANLLSDIVAEQMKESQHSSFSLSPRSATVIISILSMISCTLDMRTLTPPSSDNSETVDKIMTIRMLLLGLSQATNSMLLAAAFVENPVFIQIYLYYTLSFVVMGFIGVLIDFLYRAQEKGTKMACLVLLPEVAFLFVLFRCLPLVDEYARELESRGGSNLSL